MGNSLRAHKELSDRLVSAASHGAMDEVRVLLQHGVDPNSGQKTIKGTALHAAVRTSDVNMCHLLLEFGADPNTVDKSGQRAVDLAVVIANQAAKTSVIGFKDSRSFDSAASETLLQERANVIEALLTKYDKERAIQLLHSRLHDLSPQVPDAVVQKSAILKREARIGRVAKKGHGRDSEIPGSRRTRTPSPTESRGSSTSKTSKESEDLIFKTPTHSVVISNGAVEFNEKNRHGISQQLQAKLYGSSPVA